MRETPEFKGRYGQVAVGEIPDGIHGRIDSPAKSTDQRIFGVVKTGHLNRQKIPDRPVSQQAAQERRASPHA